MLQYYQTFVSLQGRIKNLKTLQADLYMPSVEAMVCLRIGYIPVGT
jgi:hypothetical protein